MSLVFMIHVGRLFFISTNHMYPLVHLLAACTAGPAGGWDTGSFLAVLNNARDATVGSKSVDNFACNLYG